MTEDRSTERFVRRLLKTRGFEPRRFDFRTAPAGTGAAEAWVRQQYPAEVRNLRSRAYQRCLCVIAVRDGDAVGVAARKAELDTSLVAARLGKRNPEEPIATPVPTWSIENWLLDLLGHGGIDENQKNSGGPAIPWKDVYERLHGADEKGAHKQAAIAWARGAVGPEIPSLQDGRVELARIDP